MKLSSRRLLSLLLAALMVTALLAACSGDSANTPPPAANTPGPGTTPRPTPTPGVPTATPIPPAPADYVITILTISHDGDIIQPNHPNFETLKSITGYNIELEYVLNASFAEQMNARLAARNLPGVVVFTGLTGPVVQAIQGGAFWDITDLYEDYTYLAMADRGIMNAISVGGRYYGIYRARRYPRSGMQYRSDWLQNLNMKEPTNLNELYDVLYAFTHNDPTGTGAETYGMTWCQYMGPFYNLAVMHGAPNRFGVRDGKLTPWFEYNEFIEAMDYSKRLYDNGLINRDFAALPSGQWINPFNTGIAGFHIDVVDQANRSATALRDNGLITQAQVDDGSIVWPMGAVANKNGEVRLWPQNIGAAGFVAISTVGARTELDLHYHLDFLDLCNSEDGQNALNFGTEGITYEKRADGTVRGYTTEEVLPQYNVRTGWNQFMMNTVDMLWPPQRNPRQQRDVELDIEMLPYTITDPTVPLATSATAWSERQATLNTIVDDAVINYIMGNINLDGFRAEMRRWYAEGGTEALAQLQTAFDASN